MVIRENDEYTSESETAAILSDPETVRAIAEGTGDYGSWTSCQYYGHNFVDGRCTDCPEVSE